MAQTALSHPQDHHKPRNRPVLGRPRVLDAACGLACVLGRWSAAGQVVGFDLSFRMVHTCRARVGQGDFRVHDLAVAIEAISA